MRFLVHGVGLVLRRLRLGLRRDLAGLRSWLGLRLRRRRGFLRFDGAGSEAAIARLHAVQVGLGHLQRAATGSPAAASSVTGIMKTAPNQNRATQAQV